MIGITRRQFMWLIGAATQAKKVKAAKVVKPTTGIATSAAKTINLGREISLGLEVSLTDTARNVARQIAYRDTVSRLGSAPGWYKYPARDAESVRSDIEWVKKYARKWKFPPSKLREAARKGRLEGLAQGAEDWFQADLPYMMRGRSKALTKSIYPGPVLDHLKATRKKREVAQRWAAQWRTPKGFLTAGG